MAHVDTPKGDLDASSGALTGPDVTVAVNDFVYPQGSTEQFPATKDVMGNVLTNTAHEYRECSNKGICDRSSGTCGCFEGYEGAACQRASCPTGPNGVCSGHGTCHTISEIADLDYGNYYKLWDESVTMGCVCDGGYEGPDCSQRKCKYGVDPLYKDNNATIRYSNFTYQFYHVANGAATTTLSGNYSIVFYDSYGEDWETAPIAWNADCDTITSTLESLPNGVIPQGSVRCYKFDTAVALNAFTDPITAESVVYNSNTYYYRLFSKYTIAFPQNPGKLDQIRINKFLDGTRPTLYTAETTSTLGWHIFPNGFIGEDVDFVPDRCFGVKTTISYDSVNQYYYLNGLDATELKLIKTCLGDGDGNTADNVDVYNWDFGDSTHPHLIKLQDATQYNLPFRRNANNLIEVDEALTNIPKTQLCASIAGNPQRFGATADGVGFCSNIDAPAFYAVTYWDSVNSIFKLLTNAGKYYDVNTEFFVYTTKGYLQLVSSDAAIFTYVSEAAATNNRADLVYSADAQFNSYYSNVLHMVNTSHAHANYYGDLSCENNNVGTNGLLDCVNKNDFVMILDSDTPANNPIYPNIYKVKKIANENKALTSEWPAPRHEISRLQLTLDYSLNAAYPYDGTNTNLAAVYKFYPDPTTAAGGYHYAGPCSMRGLCNTDNGLCECFNSQCKDDCSCINNLMF